jgi:hypothetical protein
VSAKCSSFARIYAPTPQYFPGARSGDPQACFLRSAVSLSPKGSPDSFVPRTPTSQLQVSKMGVGDEDGTFVKGQNKHKNTTCTEHVETNTAKWRAGSKMPGKFERP